MLAMEGQCDERFAALRDYFECCLASDTDLGMSIAVSVRGECVVDLWGGYRDLERVKPWEADTIVRVASTSKIPVALATLMLWDRGLLDLDEPIAAYWPEFGQNGKSAITTRQVLLHCAGVPGYGVVPTREDLLDYSRMVAIVERAPVWYEPGTVTCYHAGTFGYILGELVQRVSGLPIEQFVAEEITGPLEADFSFSLRAPAEFARVAQLRTVESPDSEQSEMVARVEAEDVNFGDLSDAASGFARVAPGDSGLTNARALVRIGDIISLRGDVAGRRFLSQHAVDEAVREHSYENDEMFGVVRRGLFFALDSAEFPAITPTSAHWGGFGGSWLSMDPASGVSCAYTPNLRLTGDAWAQRANDQWRIVREVLQGVSP